MLESSVIRTSKFPIEDDVKPVEKEKSAKGEGNQPEEEEVDSKEKERKGRGKEAVEEGQRCRGGGR